MKVLYVTYDGLLDPLGASQILPYLKDIASTQGGAVVLSFEKNERYLRGGAALSTALGQYDIYWQPLRFTSGKGFLGKAWDLLRMCVWGCRLAVRYQIKVVHSRGHPAAQIGLFIKRLTDAQLIFDLRGLWVDERVDKGGWDLQRSMHRLQYRYFKRIEYKLLSNADHVVVLTEAVVPEIRRLGVLPSTPVTVIPCCADFEHFPLVDNSTRIRSRDELRIPRDARVLGYLGSVGRMYMLDRVLRLFEMADESYHEVHLLVVTQDVAAMKTLVSECLPIGLRRHVHVRAAGREQVPLLISAMDVLISFIKPSYARVAASPTKLAECFATGIPVICNTGVGDVENLVRLLRAGRVIDQCSDSALTAAIADLDGIITMGGFRLREEARQVFGLEVATSRYRAVYAALK